MSRDPSVRVLGQDLSRSDVEAVLADAKDWSAAELVEYAEVGPGPAVHVVDRRALL